jgi:hypothetical protein
MHPSFTKYGAVEHNKPVDLGVLDFMAFLNKQIYI